MKIDILATRGGTKIVPDPLQTRLIDVVMEFPNGRHTLREEFANLFTSEADPDALVEIRVTMHITANGRQWRTWKYDHA